MGCDYYVVKCLCVYFNDIDNLRVELQRERGYFFEYDKDDDDYEAKLNEHIKKCLTPKEPIIIYNNNKFNKSTFEISYKSIVENKINGAGKI